ncbi:hypothetical protein [Lysinibacillus varians]|uniref:DUF2569 domain-containing protein n=1 Tax=Lysinibacillus varians TaxID=1145276 RepID=A0ABY2T9M3_9BACI|nr:hypothetical protein [Lysinibacillus varians]AHN24018.1 hypothetical protein T479_06695 [Lysinibacillus varians]TKI59517.1 hypothetical protein FC752_18100 [Lysinibacillus varians]
MVSSSVVKKLVVPIVYVAEWIFFLYVLLCIVVFNLVNLTNVIAVDMAWEEPINFTASFINSMIVVLGIGLICFFYIKFLAGSRAYKRFKEVVWGVLFGINTVSCVICGSIVYGFNFIHADGIILLTTAFISALLTMQIIMKQDFEGQ